MAAEHLEMKRSRTGDVVRIFIKGRISTSTSNRFSLELTAALRLGPKKIILDMSEVQFLSSLGIRSILSTYRQAAAMGGKLLIANPPPSVKNVLGMAALNSMLLEE